MRFCKPFLATISAVVLLGAFVGSSAARNLSLTSQTMRVAFRSVNFASLTGTVSCPITVEGSLHARTLPKVVSSLVGYITRVDLGPCHSGQATILRETLPWHGQFVSFSGVLPEISAIRFNVIGVGFRVREPVSGAICLATSTAARPAVGTFTRDLVTRALTTSEGAGVFFTSCGVEASFSTSREVVTMLNNSTRVTLTLI
jgi:hypothetical protein